MEPIALYMNLHYIGVEIWNTVIPSKYFLNMYCVGVGNTVSWKKLQLDIEDEQVETWEEQLCINPGKF